MNTPLSLSSRAVVLSAATALLATVAKAAPPFDPHATTTTTMIQDDEEKEKEVVDELAEEWSSEKNGEEEEPFSDDDEGGLAKIDQSPDNKDEKADSIFMDSKQDDEEIAVDASEEFDEKLDEPIEDGTEPTAEAGDESFDEERVAEQEEEEEPLDILEEEGGEEPEQQQQEDEANETVKDNLDVNDDDSFGLGDDKETEITTDIFGDDKAEEEETALDAPEEATDEAIEDTTELNDEKLSDDLEEEDQEDPEQQTNEEELPEIAEENIVDPEPSDEQLLDDGIEESEEPSIDSEQDSVKDFVDEVIEGSENDETKEQDGTFTGDGESAETDMPVEEAWDEDQNAEQESNEEEVQETSEDFPTQVIDMEDKTTEPDSLLDDQIDDDKKDTEVTVPGIVDEEKSSDFLPTSNDTKQDDDFLGAIQEIQDEETEQVVNDINESLEKALDAFQDNQEAPPFGAPSQEPPSTPSHDTTGFLLDENDTKQNDTSGSTLNVLLFIAVLALILLKLPKIKVYKMSE